MLWSNSRSHLATYLVLIIIVLFCFAASAVSLCRYWQFEADYYDFGIFDTVLWQVSRFKPPIADHFVMEGKWIFADHFYPSLFLIAPLYWFTDNQEIILITQALCVALAGWFVFITAKHLTQSQLAGCATLIALFCFTGLQNALWFDVHEVTFMVLPLSICIWAIATDKWKLFWLSFIITLGFKESSFLITSGLAAYMFFTKPKHRLMASIAGIVSLIYGVVVIKLLIPYFSGADYFYSEVFSYQWSNPLTYWKIFTDSPIKIKTLMDSFLSFGALPILAVPLWPAYFLHFLSRFTSTPIRWELGLHYSAELAPLLALGTSWSLAFIKRRISQKVILILSVILILTAGYLFRVKFHGPLLLATNKAFYQETSKVNYPQKIIDAIPKTASVMAQQNLASHLTHHRKIWILRSDYYKYQPEYIAIDPRPGLRSTHFWGLGDLPDILDKEIHSDPNYHLVSQSQTAKLYCRVDICLN